MRPGVHEPSLTALEFAAMPRGDGHSLELVRGRIVREPRPGPVHGRVTARLAVRLGAFVERTGSGVVLVETGFALTTDPDTVRAPDLSFVARDRVPEGGYGDRYWRLAPDLAVEILSPSNTASYIQAKVLDYLDAGTRLTSLAQGGAHV